MSIDVLAPPLGTTVDTVTLVNWYRHEGEMVRQGEPLFAVETDKATLDVEAPASGILRQVSCAPGSEVKVLSRIAVIAAPDEVIELPKVEPSAAVAPSQILNVQPAPERKDGRTFISPRAKRLAEEQGVEWQALQGTGPEGAIVERDVEAYLKTQQTRKITPVAERMAQEAGLNWTQLSGTGIGGRITREDIAHALASTTAAPSREGDQVLETLPVTGVREVIAGRMAQSASTTARVTLTAEADATALVELRANLAADGVAVSYNDLFLYVLARALREQPRLNASLQGDAIQVWRRIHIGLAVDTDRGLIVPVVRDVDRKGLAEIARETTGLIEAVQQGKVLPDDLRGGTFTLTNLGMYGIDAFTPIINLPECAILGVGRISARPTVVDNQVVVRQMVWLSLAFDHRLVDGGPAARFLQRVVQLIGHPHLLLS
jgi:pyruvate dehydrogenase E2 component (dihydrolipoamide acetyltransferase)